MMLKEFDLNLVQVTDPYYVNAFDKVVEYLLRLDPERLVVGFKAVSEGKDPQHEPGLNLYGGWEGAWSLLRGHTMGHYLTAMAQAYKQSENHNPTLSAKLKQNIDYAIDQLKACQDASPNGFLFASPETHFDVIEGKYEGKHWVPWYSMHKIVTGLVHVYNYTKNEVALEIASRLGDWSYERTSKWDTKLHQRVLNIEYGAINDALYELYKITNDSRHLAAAKMFDEDELFAHIVKGENVFENRHANTQIPKFVGALNRYRVLGEEADFYFKTAQEFWTMVVNDHTYVTGGNSECEHFRKPGMLDATRTNLNNEGCNTYNMLLLSRELFKITGDLKYANYYERALINEIMASINPETGMVTYFKPMDTGYFKAFGTETESFWCCTGTGMENYTKLNDSVYFHNDQDLYVNLYLSSQLNWDEKGLELTQEANIPNEDRVKFRIVTAPTEQMTINFRVPSWIAHDQEMTLSINGKAYAAKSLNGYLSIDRDWADGDIVELLLPTEVKVSRLPDNPNSVAFCYGPLVLCAKLGTEQMIATNHWASIKPTMPEEVMIKDYIIVQNGSVDQWIDNIHTNLVKTPGKLEFTLEGTDEKLKLVPFYSEYKERYGIYFRMVELDSPALQKIVEERKNVKKRVEATIDSVQVTNDQFELVHNLQGNSSGGFFVGHNLRQAYGEADGEGWFSYDFNVDPLVDNYLSTSYYSGDAGRSFNIYIDDQLLVEETIDDQSPQDFYDVRYPIPSEWLKDKAKVTVKFANRGQGWAGGVYDRVAILNDFDTNSELKTVIIDGTEAKLTDSSYVSQVDAVKTKVKAKFIPEHKHALVYVDEILIDDTQERVITLDGDDTSVRIRVVAADGETEQLYNVNIVRN